MHAPPAPPSMYVPPPPAPSGYVPVKPEAPPAEPAAELSAGVNSDRKQREGSAESPVPGTSGIKEVDQGKVVKPRRYRTVSREAETGPGSEVILKNFLEAVNETDSSGEEGTSTRVTCK
ncbi:hypothetical protein RF55_17554 [Lasius niger]|uniref:Uncharacterized protein n=1 Tax=Lasius niger TaxID=67767 RepID=A0A0J7K2B9_LASNI|nr:hypothetical protein RF55_17554 [Lasius niger]